MTDLDRARRSAIGSHEQAEVMGALAPEPATLFESSWRDFVFAEVWTRPGLDRRSRFLVGIAGAAVSGAPDAVLERYIRGALTLGELSLAELREAALQLAVYGGWSRAAALDAAVTRVAAAMRLPATPFEPLGYDLPDAHARRAAGLANFEAVSGIPGPPPFTPFLEVGVLDFVFAEVWSRPGLDQRARRWITLTCVADCSAEVPVRTHCHAAMATGDATREEMLEFVLQYAIHGGWPRASILHQAVLQMAERVARGLPCE